MNIYKGYFVKMIGLKGLQLGTSSETENQAHVSSSHQGERVATFRHNGTMVIVRTISAISKVEIRVTRQYTRRQMSVGCV